VRAPLVGIATALKVTKAPNSIPTGMTNILTIECS